MSTSSRTVESFVAQLAKDYPQFKFKSGKQTHWSPRRKTVIYNLQEPSESLIFGLLHELAHGLLRHTNYSSDFELLKLESEAWELAASIGSNYRIIIDDEHIQNCLDTYRDWLHKRSTCPACGTHVMQKDTASYHCYNCQTQWKVANDRFVRPYRKTLR